MPEVSENVLSDKEILTQVSIAGAKEKVGPLDPDFLLIFLFALLMDGLDIMILVVKIFTLFTIGEVISKGLDIFTFIIIGGWIYLRVGRISKSKRARVKTLKKTMEKRVSALSRIMAKGIKSPFLRTLVKGGIAFLGEIITIIGLLPFWTISVVLMLREK